MTVFARRAELLEQTVSEIAGLGSGAEALAVTGDSTDPAALAAAVDGTKARFGRIDIVVNNTGGPPAGGFEDFDDDGWAKDYGEPAEAFPAGEAIGRTAPEQSAGHATGSAPGSAAAVSSAFDTGREAVAS